MSLIVVAQESNTTSTITIDEPMMSLSIGSSHTRHASWSLASNLGTAYAYELESHSSKPKFVAEVELRREVDRWHNIVGVNLYDVAIFTMQVWEIHKGKFPVGLLAYGEYSHLEKESFFGVGSQVSFAKQEKERCTLRLYVGSPVEEFKPSVGLQFIIPFVEEL